MIPNYLLTIIDELSAMAFLNISVISVCRYYFYIARYFVRELHSFEDQY